MGDDVIGYRFHPNDEEIISHYLDNKLKDLPDNYINEVDILKYEPWDLPARSAIASDDEEWYFLWALDYKFANSRRASRMTKAGFWKVTGKERTIRNKKHKVIGTKRTLVFHLGRGPNAKSTKWVITEYRSYSDNSRSDQKEYVVCRLKIKPNDKFDTTTSNEPSPQSAADNRNHVTEDPLALVTEQHSYFTVREKTNSSNSCLLLCQFCFQANFELSAEGQSLLFNGLELELLMDQQQEPLFSNGSSDEHNMPNYQLDARDDDNDFVNSFLVDEDEYSLQETVRTHHHGFDPPKSLTGVYFEGSSDSDDEILNIKTAQSSLPRNFAGRKPQLELQSYVEPKGHIPYMRSIYTIDVTPNRGKSLPKSHDLVDRETAPRQSHESIDSVTSRRQLHASVESVTSRRKSYACETAPRRLQLLGKSAHEVSFKEEERGGAAEDAVVDSALRKKSVVKIKKEEKKIQRNSSRSNVSDGSKRKSYFISQEIPPPASIPPFVYIVNVLIAVLLFVFFVWEMAYIH